MARFGGDSGSSLSGSLKRLLIDGGKKENRMEKRRMVYTTKEGIVEAMTFVYNNAQDNTARQLAEKLGVSYGSVNMVLKTMRKAGIDVKTSGKRQVSSLYREAIEEFKNLLSEGLV